MSKSSYHCWLKEVNTDQTRGPHAATFQADSINLNIVQRYQIKFKFQTQKLPLHSSVLLTEGDIVQYLWYGNMWNG